MLKKHGQLFLTAVFIFDSIVIIFSWLAAYYIRFKTSIGPPLRYAIPEIDFYLWALIPVWMAFMFNIRLCGLYKPLRGKPITTEFFNIIKVGVLSILILTALTFFYREYSFSRYVVVFFWALVTFLLIISHMLVRLALIEARRRGLNIRHILIVGAGDLGQAVAEKINLHPEFGINIIGFLTTHSEKIGKELNGIQIIGADHEISKVIYKYRIDQLYIALPLSEHDKMEKVLENLAEETVDIKVVPDLLQFMNLQAGVEDLDGLPVIN
ncbi:uncharacterized protein METZ01_LOCUS395614, partial [marine metagenome]